MSNDKQTTSYDKILKNVSQKGTALHSFKKTYPAYLILIILIALSFLVRDIVTKQIESDLQNEFNQSTSNIISRIETVNLRNLEVLYSMSGLYDLIIDVVRDYFELYATVPTRTYSDISGISYVAQVDKASLDNFIFYVRSQGYYDFEIKNQHDGDLHYLINHSVPYSRNIHRIGLDFASDRLMIDEVEFARDNNKTTSTPFYETRPDTLGLFLLSPIYKFDTVNDDIEARRQNFQGVVSVELNAQKFFESALSSEFFAGSSFTPIDTTIIFEIFDKDENGNLFTIYASPNSKQISEEFEPFIEENRTVVIGYRDITIRFYTQPNYGGQFAATMPLASLLISLLISFAFFGFVYSVVTSRSRALDLADRMTRSQRRIVEASKDIIAVMKFDRTWISMNPASLDIFGIDESEVIGTEFDSYIYEQDNQEDANKLHKLLEKNIDYEFSERIYLKMKFASGGFRWVNWLFTISPKENLIYCIGRDVTSEKIADEQSLLQQKQLKLAELFAREGIASKNYFMKKISHRLRNSLTSIFGYLQLLKEKMYDDQEELDNFINMASESGEEIYTLVSDIIDTTVVEDNSNSLEIMRLGDIYDIAYKQIQDHKNENRNIISKISDDSKLVKLFADRQTMIQALYNAFDILSAGERDTEISIFAEENSYEKVTEIQILGSVNSFVTSMIIEYKNSKNNLIHALQNDNHDFLLKVAKVKSYINIMGATMTIDYLGENEGNLIVLHIPFLKH